LPLRILHTSDWHLGHTLHDVPRAHEHERFLVWLGDTLEAERIDSLIIAGDVFETANPSAAAQSVWYEFLASTRARLPDLDIAVVAGNHDSAGRLDAPQPLLRGLRIHVVGGVPRTESGAVDVDRMVVPLHDSAGTVAAQLVAVPFLRPADLPRDAEGPTGDPLIEGVRSIYARVIDRARELCAEGQALVATGHCYMIGTSLSKTSERRILGGNQHALPMDIFPDDIAYAALGHLHKPQRVGKREHIRYCGSPIPLAMSEARFRHQVLAVDLDGAELANIQAIEVPRAVDMIRIPASGSAPLDEVLPALAALPPLTGSITDGTRPHLEVVVALTRPEPKLRELVEAELEHKSPRLLKLSVEYTGDGASLAESIPAANLRDLDPLDVFLRRYRRDHESEPESRLIDAFSELLDRARCEVER
jgi:exonuclease SbcD